MDPRELREATRTEHESTEALMPLMGPGLTRDQYVATLQALLPIVQSWERWAAKNAPETIGHLLAPRRRAQLLLADLRTFGADADLDPDGGVDWQAVVGAPEGRQTGLHGADDFAARFLGAMYVMEGSTLGGRFLARQVETELALTPGHGNAYFRGHGDATGALWREVTAALSAVAESRSPAVIAAAKRAFRAFGDALQVNKFAPQPVRN